jgi:hypothetical protein
MFYTKGINIIKLRWKATKRITVKENLSKIVYDKAKEPSKDLKQFIQEERAKDAEIELDYIIDGKDLAFQLNINYFRSRYIGNSNGVKNPLPMSYNYRNFDEINFSYQKLLIKRHLGQQLNYEDCYSVVSNYPKPENLDGQAAEMMTYENKDTMLYCSACCGDRLCGYLGMQVYQSEESFIWDIGLTKQPLRLEFTKENYLSELQEYLDLVNTGLNSSGIDKISPTSPGTKLPNFEDDMQVVEKKYFNKEKVDLLETLELIFQSESIENIDKGIFIAVENGLDINSIKNKIEIEYHKLSKSEKSGLEWGIIDESSYMRTKNLKFRKESMKAYLLYKRRKSTEANTV